jgi:hypothetical protein
MKEISPEFDVSREEFSGENRETHWKNIFDFKRLRVSEQKLFTGLIETDGVALCVHYRRLKKDRPVPPSAAPVTKGKRFNGVPVCNLKSHFVSIDSRVLDAA